MMSDKEMLEKIKKVKALLDNQKVPEIGRMMTDGRIMVTRLPDTWEKGLLKKNFETTYL